MNAQTQIVQGERLTGSTRSTAFALTVQTKCVLALLLCVMLPGFVKAATISLNPVADAYIRQFDPDRSLGDYGSEPSLVSGALGSRAQFEVRRALLRFDLGQVPAGALVGSATLKVTVVMVPLTPINSTFDVRRVLQLWSEAAVSWNSRLGSGTPWQVPGATGSADSAPTPSSFVQVGSASFTDYTFPSSAGLVADVQGWVNDPSSNFGWLLISEDEVSPETARRFGSREDPSHPPVLTINYTLPSLGVTIQPSSQNVTAGSNVTFTANATGIAPFFYQWSFNGNPIAGATGSSLVLPNVQTSQSGSYTVTVSNQTGMVTSSPATLTVTAVSGPTVAITSPTNGAVFPAHSDVLLAADATETNGVIAEVEFLLGTNSVGVVSNSPFSMILSNLAAGSYTLTARATDGQGNTAVSEPISFSTGVPVVTITSPTNGAKFPINATIAFSADASEPGAVITQVEFFVDTNSIGVATVAPFSITRSGVTAGNHLLTAQATDNQGNVVLSPAVNFSVIEPPGVVVSSPAAGSRFPVGTNITVAANVASKGANIVRVDFFASVAGADATNIGTVANLPYALNWLPAGAGDFTLTAAALDELGQMGQSTGVVARVFIPEIILPTVSITNGLRNFARTTESPITLSGTASDNIGIDRVEFSVSSGPLLQNIGPFMPAEGTENWIAQVPLQPGKNAVRVRSVDLANNKSPIVTRFYTYFVERPLTIVTNGVGSVLPNLDGRNLELGRVYAVTARPGPGDIFSHWEIRTNADLSITNNVQISTRPTLSFQMRSNLVLVADFVPNQFPNLAGTYSGLFFDANTNLFRPENAGFFGLQLGARGAFSGRIMLLGATHAFRGSFDPNGRAQVGITRRAQPPVSFSLQLDMSGGSGAISGVVTTSSDANTLTSSLLATRRVAATSRQTAFSLSDDAGERIVNAIAFISSAGGVRIQGILQSSHSFNFAASIAADGRVPFYVAVNHGSEVIIGWLQFGGAEPVGGQLYWVSSDFAGVALLNAVVQ